MVNIYFFNVGQGDSIIIESIQEKESKFTIVDCNLDSGRNPVLEFIKAKKIQNLNNLLLSHPHTDHFSGYSELVDYCYDNNIPIDLFGHTAYPLKIYQDKVIKSLSGKSDFAQLLDSLGKSTLRGLIKKCGYLSSTSILAQFGIKIAILSPGEDEYKRVEAKQDYEEETEGNFAMGNWLSTIIKLEFSEGFVLLTGDGNKDALHRIDKIELDKDEKLLLGQIPHHGSVFNHSHAFWKKRKRDKNTPIVVSFGANSYGHPVEKVITDFGNDGYKIYSTNLIKKIPKTKAEDLVLRKEELDIYSDKADLPDGLRYLKFSFADTGKFLRATEDD